MEITYKNKKLQKVCTDFSAAETNYGEEMALKIFQRIDEISVAPDVNFLISHNFGRCHRLSGTRKNQYAVDLMQPYRLIFTIQNGKIQIAKILEIVDYH